MAEHRVPMLRASLRRASLRGRVDPEHSTDPKVRELVAALSTLEVAPAPRADFRAELRAQLVAVTPRLVAEGDPTLTTADERAQQQKKAAARAIEADRPRARSRFVRPLIATACLLTAFVVLLGGAVWISKKALPGDALYGLKRASENTEYSFTGGTVAKARLKLEFAKNRIDEVADLLPRASAMGAGVGDVAGGGVNSETASLVRETLSSADGDIKDAARMLTQAATRNKTAAPLNVFIAWAPGQSKNMLNNVVGHIPTSDTALIARAKQTWTLIQTSAKHAQTLRKTVTAATTTPTTPPVTTTPRSTKPGSPSTHSTTPGTAHSGTAAPTTHNGTGSGKATGTRSGGGSVSTTPKPPKSSLPITLPTKSTPGRILPSGLLPSSILPSGILPAASSSAKLPVSIDSCGVHATLGPIGINLGSC